MDGFIYQYTVGGAVFALGLVLAMRQGYLGLSGRPLRNLLLCLGGLLFFVGVQGYLQYGSMTEADAVPYRGGWERQKVLGTSLDYAIMVIYFLAMLVIGTWFGRHNKSTKDFFFGGQRFSWWLIAFSLVATTIGSYSFVKYSGWRCLRARVFVTYLNDWLWVPLLLWLAASLYFSKVVSIPEFLIGGSDRRRGSARGCPCTYWLQGINLFTMGQALNILLGWPALRGVLPQHLAVYVTFGGQTSVIMTDLLWAPCCWRRG